MKPRLIVHGGAWDIPDSLWDDHQEGCRIAYEVGLQCLNDSGSAVDAVVDAVRILEDDPTFDAGKGSFLNRDGFVELDAGIMRGSDLATGAVGAIRRFHNPIAIARALMEKGPHVLLVAGGAEEWANSMGFQTMDPSLLVVERELVRFDDYKAGRSSPDKSLGGDTVGAIAMDTRGSIAVATSTGGAAYKWGGRLGDTPIPGAGFYADDRAGAAAITGDGEMSLRLGLARIVVEWMAHGSPAPEAAKRGVKLAVERLNARIGVLTMDCNGLVGTSHSTPKMSFNCGG